MLNEADTCRKFITPKLLAAGWDDEPHSLSEQKTFTDGRIVVTGSKTRRRLQKRADYLLRYTRDFTVGVVEAKSEDELPGQGLQQAKEYAEILGLQFAYSTNGHGIIEFDYINGTESELNEFPKPDELWHRLCQHEQLTDSKAAERLLAPFRIIGGMTPRYYQEIAINRAVRSILKGKKRVLLTMATGTGKTYVAFQVCWKLWNSRWNTMGQAHRKPRILFLADRNVLVDDPKDKMFTAFGDARYKIEHGNIVKSREMYFAIYQAIAQREDSPGLYKQFAPDFFDLIIVDECHRGSARSDSNWREILEYFSPAFQLGMTATPKRKDNVDTYAYFGDPIYTYSLRQGIDDGFLAPYRVHRVVTEYDATGWRPDKGMLDRYGYAIPDEEYQTPDFERVVSLRARTQAIARHLTTHLKKSDRFGKTIVFCVDQEHAEQMRHELTNLNSDIVQQHPSYVVRITSDEGDVGRRYLDQFMDVETKTPTVVTTSKLLTTGVDIPTCFNIVLVSIINSMTEFKQIIGRGTRVRDDYGKLYFNILDYTGSATRLFADPDFDGDPSLVTETEINAEGEEIAEPEVVSPEEETGGEDVAPGPIAPTGGDGTNDGGELKHRKYYVDGGWVAIAAHLVYELDAEGNRLNTVEFTEYVANSVRAFATNTAELRKMWANPITRAEVIEKLDERGIDFAHLAEVLKQPDADRFDLLCHVAFSAPIRTRRERAEALRKGQKHYFEQYSAQAREILNELLEKYVEYGMEQFKLPEVLKVPPISEHGNPTEIVQIFGSAGELKEAFGVVQTMLYQEESEQCQPEH